MRGAFQRFLCGGWCCLLELQSVDMQIVKLEIGRDLVVHFVELESDWAFEHPRSAGWVRYLARSRRLWGERLLCGQCNLGVRGDGRWL